MSSTIVQYVLLRSDLVKELGWSIGALVAQACHACTAVLHIYRDDETTAQYLSDLNNMHKVVLEVSLCRKLMDSRALRRHSDLIFLRLIWPESS